MKFRYLLLAAFIGMALAPKPALALPTFAQAYHVDCSLCHSFVPALNAYGRYVQSTGFGALDPKVMNKVIPIVFRETLTYKSVSGSNKLDPGLKYTYANLSVNVVGVLNKYLSYRLEQSLYSNNLGGGSTGHFWVSYNQLFNGDGHLIVGKFDVPSAPQYSYWMDIAGFAEPSIAVGQHSYNLSGSRWGAEFAWVPKDYKHMPYKAEIAYVGNGNPIYNASTFSASNPYLTGAAQSVAGSDKAFFYKGAWARPDNPVEVGFTGAAGTYILNTGYAAPIDRYNAWGAYALRDPGKHFPGIAMSYQTTYDSNIGPSTAKSGLVQPAHSWAYSFELDQPFYKGNVVLAVRPVEYLNGLNACANNGGGSIPYPTSATKSCTLFVASGNYAQGYTRPHYGAFDLLMRDPKISRYLWVQFEDTPASAGYNKTYNPFNYPTWKVDIRWASGITGPMFGTNY